MSTYQPSAATTSGGAAKPNTNNNNSNVGSHHVPLSTVSSMVYLCASSPTELSEGVLYGRVEDRVVANDESERTAERHIHITHTKLVSEEYDTATQVEGQHETKDDLPMIGRWCARRRQLSTGSPDGGHCESTPSMRDRALCEEMLEKAQGPLFFFLVTLLDPPPSAYTRTSPGSGTTDVTYTLYEVKRDTLGVILVPVSVNVHNLHSSTFEDEYRRIQTCTDLFSSSPSASCSCACSYSPELAEVAKMFESRLASDVAATLHAAHETSAAVDGALLGIVEKEQRLRSLWQDIDDLLAEEARLQINDDDADDVSTTSSSSSSSEKIPPNNVSGVAEELLQEAHGQEENDGTHDIVVQYGDDETNDETNELERDQN